MLSEISNREFSYTMGNCPFGNEETMCAAYEDDPENACLNCKQAKDNNVPAHASNKWFLFYY